MSQKVQVRKVSNPDDLNRAHAVRYEVFVTEQNCPPHLEREHDDIANHFLATIDGEPAGASRWRRTDSGYKLERFAVLSKFRGLGVGQELVKAVLADLPANAELVYLHAQVQAVGLYKKFNFEVSGPEFKEAGIRHYKMVWKR